MFCACLVVFCAVLVAAVCLSSCILSVCNAHFAIRIHVYISKMVRYSRETAVRISPEVSGPSREISPEASGENLTKTFCEILIKIFCEILTEMAMRNSQKILVRFSSLS